jgi:hypothetical protein
MGRFYLAMLIEVVQDFVNGAFDLSQEPTFFECLF